MSVSEDQPLGTAVGDAPNASARLFTGLDLPEDITARLTGLVDGLRPVADLRWSRVENLHITTKFIGNWAVDRLAEMQTAIAGATADIRPFDVEIRGLGWFPNPHQPHTFWTGVHAGDSLSSLHAKTDAAAASLGVPKETKTFAPHLTLAKVPAGGKTNLAPMRRAVAALDSVDFGGFRADRFFLYQSKPGPTGSVYLKLAEFLL